LTDLLKVENLESRINTSKGSIYVLNGVNFKLMEGETVGIFGESGSGKSILFSAITRDLIPPGPMVITGRLVFLRRELVAALRSEYIKLLEKNIGIVMQDSSSQLTGDSIGKQIIERIITQLGMKKEEARSTAIEILQRIGFPDAAIRIDENPANLSYGLGRLVSFGYAIASNPKLLLMDEPFAGLDVIHQSQIIELINQMRIENGVSTLFSSHDPAVIASMAQRVLVLCGGFIVEEGSVGEIFSHPEHPYTLGLFGSQRRFNNSQHSKLDYMNGFTPIFTEKPKLCPFLSRCKFSVDRCKVVNPVLKEVGIDHSVACWVDLKTGKARI
jgi:oligopeptide/dipeptide ABC transporter ATP-binding protein